MIYLDSSVLLARLFREARSPSETFWDALLVSSRLLEYETYNRIHVRAPDGRYLPNAQRLIEKVDLSELTPNILDRALKPFPVPVRTLDALHLATMDYLRSSGASLDLATYDARLAVAAQAMGFSLAAL